MTKKSSIQHEMLQVIDLLRHYFKRRLQKESIQNLNLVVHDLRILLHKVIIDHFLHLSLVDAKQFRLGLADQLNNVCGELYGGCSVEDEDHHRYCIREVMACFEWAEQIKEEIPDDLVTQKILAVDIPILRPFDYSSGTKKGIPRFHKKP
ncbi:MAG: hypothetical protein Q7T03_08395 [Deltaproteobacteria bacterium]|nr:hypothetical protein [Deltaproteobacteria bacterium]